MDEASPPPDATPLPRLFISAVSDEFRSLRQQVAGVVRQLGYQAVSMDDWPAGHGELRAWLREQIDSGDGLIHIPGAAYGAEPEVRDPAAHGLPVDTPRYSYTQYEFLYAQARGKKTWVIQPGPGCTRDTPVERLDLPADPTTPDPVAWQSERRALQAAWIQRLKRENHLRHQPKDDKELQLLLHTLRDHAQEMRQRFGDWQDFVAAHMRRTEKRQRRLLAMVAGALVLLVLVGVGVWLVKRDSGKTVVKVDAILTKQDEAAKKLDQMNEVEPLMRRALKIDEISYGPNHPRLAPSLNNLAQLLKNTNRLSEAEPLLRRALEIDEASYGPDHPEVAVVLNNLAELFFIRNRLSEAEPLQRRAARNLLLFRQRTGIEHQEFKTTISNYLGTLIAQKLDDSAIRSRLDSLADEVPMDRAEFAKQWQPLFGPFYVTVIEVIATGQGPGLGIKAGDVIRGYRGEEITSVGQLNKLRDATQAEAIPMEIKRGDQTLKLTAKPGKLGLMLANKPRTAKSP